MRKLTETNRRDQLVALRDDVGALLELARGMSAVLDQALADQPRPAAGTPDLNRLTAGEIVELVMALDGRRPAWVRTRLQQALELRAGVRAAGGGRDRIARPPRAGNGETVDLGHSD